MTVDHRVRIYDTFTCKKVPLETFAPDKLGIYVCGPTVYDLSHVGHARCYVAFDTIVRYLRHVGFDVRFVRNITDVDDKIIARANEAGEDPLALSARMTGEYQADMAALGNVEPCVEPKVSEHLDQIVALVTRLIDKGHAYAVDGDVYFEVGSFAVYGTLSSRNLDEMRSGARVEVDARKRSPLDFALWKSAKPGEPAWDSPWGKGRPGWHIECSAMSEAYLGERFDLHGGGMDLIFPHHENEIAQSRGAHGDGTFARYWLHNGFINVRTVEGEDEKMSKSLGNFFTIREVTARHEPEALRLFLLGTHYRSPLSFEIDRSGADVRYTNVEEAERRLAYIYATLARLDAALAVGKPVDDEGEMVAPVDTFEERLRAAMNDDFNTAAALGHVSDVLTLANKLIAEPKSAPKPVRRRTLQAIRRGLDTVATVLGVGTQDTQHYLALHRQRCCTRRGIDPASIDARIADRKAARGAKAFDEADRIRDELVASGIELMDSPNGTTWRVIE